MYCIENVMGRAKHSRQPLVSFGVFNSQCWNLGSRVPVILWLVGLSHRFWIVPGLVSNGTRNVDGYPVYGLILLFRPERTRYTFRKRARRFVPGRAFIS